MNKHLKVSTIYKTIASLLIVCMGRVLDVGGTGKR